MDDIDFSWDFCEYCNIDHVNDQKECSEIGMKSKIDSLKKENKDFEDEISKLKKRLKEADGILTKFSNPNDTYWVDRVSEYTVKDPDGKERKEKVYHMKTIIQLSKLPANYLIKLPEGISIDRSKIEK